MKSLHRKEEKREAGTSDERSQSGKEKKERKKMYVISKESEPASRGDRFPARRHRRSLRAEENETSDAVSSLKGSTYVGHDYKFKLKLIIVFVLIRTAACAGLI